MQCGGVERGMEMWERDGDVGEGWRCGREGDAWGVREREDQ